MKIKIVERALLYDRELQLPAIEEYLERMGIKEEEIEEVVIDRVRYYIGTVYMDGTYDENSYIDFIVFLKDGRVIEGCVDVLIPSYVLFDID